MSEPLFGNGTITDGAVGTSVTLTVSQTSTFTGTIQDGSGQVALDVASGGFFFEGTGTYTGGTTIGNDASLRVGWYGSGGGIIGNVVDNGGELWLMPTAPV